MFRAEVKSRIGEDICIMVKMANHSWNYICECGDASDLTVKEVQNTQAVFISHTHIDHFVNFDTIIRHQIGIQRRVVICGPKGIAKQVQAKLLGYTWNLINEDAIIYEIREYAAENELHIYEIKPPKWELEKNGVEQTNVLFAEKEFSVKGVLLDHKTPSLAYKFEQVDTVKIDLSAVPYKPGRWVGELKKAYEMNTPEAIIEVDGEGVPAQSLYHLLTIKKGDQLGVIMDHAANAENHALIRTHFQGCHQVYIESFYQNSDEEQAVTNYHSYAKMSGAIMREADVKKPVPVHFSRRYDQEDIDRLKAEFQAAFKKGK